MAKASLGDCKAVVEYATAAANAFVTSSGLGNMAHILSRLTVVALADFYSFRYITKECAGIHWSTCLWFCVWGKRALYFTDTVIAQCLRYWLEQQNTILHCSND